MVAILQSPSNILNSILSFVDQHIHLIGWPLLISVAWKSSQYVSKLQTRAENSENTLQSLATNHIPHLQAGIDNIASSVDKGIDRLDKSLDLLGQNILILAKK